jgi:hypothetical protein
MPSAPLQLAKSHLPDRGILLMAIAACLLSPKPAGAAQVSLSIETGEATTTLPELATQSGINLVFSRAHVSGVRTHAVSGHLKPSEAVEQMIDGTPLGFFRR